MRLTLSVQNYVNFLGVTPNKERMKRIRKQDARILYCIRINVPIFLLCSFEVVWGNN